MSPLINRKQTKQQLFSLFYKNSSTIHKMLKVLKSGVINVKLIKLSFLTIYLQKFKS